MTSEFCLDLAQPNPTPLNAVTIDAKNVEVHHTPMLIDDFLYALRFQRFHNTTNQRVLADADTSSTKANVFE